MGCLQSNLYELKHGSLVANPARDLPAPPVIKLGPEFAHLDEFSARIPWVPDMTFLDHLTVSGNVHFAKEVVLRGTVIVVASEGSRIDVPRGSILENAVVTGNLRILEH